MRTHARSRTSDTLGAPPGPRQVAAIVGVLSLAVFMSSLDLFIVNLAFPYIVGDPISAYRDGLGLVVAFFAAAGVVSALLLTGRPVVAAVASSASSRGADAPQASVLVSARTEGLA